MKIIDNLHLCSWEEAKQLVLDLKDPFIINCTLDLPFIHENTIRVGVNDDPIYAETLSEKIHTVCRKIDNYIKTGSPVICHCLAGRSRSASVVVSYLVLYQNYTQEDAIALVRKLSPGALMFLNFQTTFDKLK